jgi:hypothetical protein
VFLEIGVMSFQIGTALFGPLVLFGDLELCLHRGASAPKFVDVTACMCDHCKAICPWHLKCLRMAGTVTTSMFSPTITLRVAIELCPPPSHAKQWRIATRTTSSLFRDCQLADAQKCARAGSVSWRNMVSGKHVLRRMVRVTAALLAKMI